MSGKLLSSFAKLWWKGEKTTASWTSMCFSYCSAHFFLKCQIFKPLHGPSVMGTLTKIKRRWPLRVLVAAEGFRRCSLQKPSTKNLEQSKESPWLPCRRKNFPSKADNEDLMGAVRADDWAESITAFRNSSPHSAEALDQPPVCLSLCLLPANKAQGRYS